jgi:hypothetical protein
MDLRSVLRYHPGISTIPCRLHVKIEEMPKPDVGSTVCAQGWS